jgi:hypothetical protein
MNQKPLDPGRQYLVKHTTQQVGATVAAVRYRVNINTLDQEPAGRLGFNDIGAVTMETKRPLFFDEYDENRTTGAFIVIDPLTNETVGAGMITARAAGELARDGEPPAVEFGASRVTPAERYIRAGHRPVAIWLRGAEELAYVLERRLFDRGCLVQVLPGYGQAEIAAASVEAGLISICVPLEEHSTAREAVKRAVGSDRFLAVSAADLPVDSEQAADKICSTLEDRGYIRRLAKPFTGGAGI